MFNINRKLFIEKQCYLDSLTQNHAEALWNYLKKSVLEPKCAKLDPNSSFAHVQSYSWLYKLRNAQRKIHGKTLGNICILAPAVDFAAFKCRLEVKKYRKYLYYCLSSRFCSFQVPPGRKSPQNDALCARNFSKCRLLPEKLVKIKPFAWKAFSKNFLFQFSLIFHDPEINFSVS